MAVLNDVMSRWLTAAGQPASNGDLNDRMYAFLGGLGYTGSLNDRLAAWLGGSGSINDRWSSYLSTRGYTGALNDRLASFFAFTPLDATSYPTPLHAAWASDPLWAPPADGAATSSIRDSGSARSSDPSSTGTARPLFRLADTGFNSHSVLEFTAASSQVLDVDVTDIPQPFTVVVVGKLSSTGISQRFIGLGDDSSGGVGSTSGNLWFMRAGTSLSDGASSTAAPHVFMATFNGASSALSIDGTSVATGAGGSTALSKWTLGAGSSASLFANFLNGKLAFAAVYSGTPLSTHTDLVRALGAYYGITVA